MNATETPKQPLADGLGERSPVTRVFSETQKARRRESARLWRLQHPRPKIRTSQFMGKPNATLPERLWARVEKRGPDECWPWQGNANPFGHGMFTFKRVAHFAHRTAYELTFGPIPAGLLACHHCDNPPCCNPAHIYVGTYKDNSLDIVRRSRNPVFFSADQVIEIRKARAMGIRTARIAAKFGCPKARIVQALNGRHYAEITEVTHNYSAVQIDPSTYPLVRFPKKRAHGQVERKLGMLRALQAGKTITEVRGLFGYDLGYLSRLKRGLVKYSVEQQIVMLEQGE